jgi:hypothetical protein
MAKLKAYMSASQEIRCECDFSFLPDIIRNQEAIDSAFSNLQLNQRKLSHSLFWFINGNHIDETALEYLKSGDVSKAEEIWVKIVNSHENIVKYYSSYNNLSTLQMCKANKKGSPDLDTLVNAFRLKYQLLASESVKELLSKITDGTYSPDSNELIQGFADDVLECFHSLSKNGTSDYSNVVTSIDSIFRLADDKIKSYITDKNSMKPLKEIEDKLLENKQERKSSPKNGVNLGSKLAKEAFPIVNLLQTIQGKGSYTYTEVSDKVAMEILQCSIDYFQMYKDNNDASPGNEALKLAQKANDFACGISAKQRIEENIKQLNDWIDDTPNRQKYNKISKEFEQIMRYIQEHEDSDISVANAKNLVTRSKPYLMQIREKLGSYDETYLNISSIVANNSIQSLIKLNNYQQTQLTNNMNYYNRSAYIESYKSSLQEAWEVFLIVAEMDMNDVIRSRYNTNRAALKDIMKDLGINPEGFWKSLFS